MIGDQKASLFKSYIEEVVLPLVKSLGHKIELKFDRLEEFSEANKSSFFKILIANTLTFVDVKVNYVGVKFKLSNKSFGYKIRIQNIIAGLRVNDLLVSC